MNRSKVLNYLLNLAKRVHWILSSQFGFDGQRFLQSIRGIPFFIHDWLKFRESYSGTLKFMPCLHDRFQESGDTQNEYFWQDLLVARWINEEKPKLHVDIGSRVDGFIAHLASFRAVEVIDVRLITAQVPGVVFKQIDLMNPSVTELMENYCDSLSCLHAIEHFGLGRYGDPIDPLGYEKGFANMAKLLKPKGTFYLSTPIGEERVEFNAHRVFDPRILVGCAQNNGLQLQKLNVIKGGEVQSVQVTPESLLELAKSCYNLGVFVFVKNV